MSAAFVKFQTFIGDLGKKVHNLNTDALKVYLSNATPNVATNAVKADVAEIATGNGYAGPIAITNAYSQSGGIGTLTGTGSVVTAAGGTIGPFRYVILYNSTPVGGPLIAYWDYGSSITLNDTETFTIAFGSSILTLQ